MTSLTARKRRRVLIATGLAIILAAGFYLGWAGLSVHQALSDIQTVAFDPATARDSLDPSEPGPQAAGGDSVGADSEAANSGNASALTSFLIIGNDSRDAFPGDRADVIMVAILPSGGDPVMFSLPRDLYLPTPCGASARINAALNGCGDVSGPEVLAIIVEDFTGIAIDHFAEVDFAGFEAAIDAVGGVEICLDYAIRDHKLEPDIILPAGCTQASGTQALNWVRSRNTQQLVGGAWQRVPGVSDLTRNQRQQELLLALLGQTANLGSLADLVAVAENVAGAVTLDEQLGISELAGFAWEATQRGSVVQLQVDVRYHTTESGASVLLPEDDFADELSNWLSLTAEATS